MKEKSIYKVDQKLKGKETHWEYIEENFTMNYRRVIKEELKNIKLESKNFDKFKSIASATNLKKFLLRPSLISTQKVFLDRKIRPRIYSPLEVKLSNEQKNLLYILYNMFRGKRILDALTIISKTLGLSFEKLLNDIMKLENMNIIELKDGIIHFTQKGEILSESIIMDRRIINKIREALAKVPNPPILKMPNIRRKTINKDLSMNIKHFKIRKNILLPAFPRIVAKHIKIRKTDNTVNTGNFYRARVSLIPGIPRLITPYIYVKTTNRSLPKMPPGINKSQNEKITESNKTLTESIEPNNICSLLSILFEQDKTYDAEGLISVRPDRPVIIVAVKKPNEDYIGTLLSILRELYRIKIGGFPVGRYVGTTSKHIAEEELLRHGFIKVYDDSKNDLLAFRLKEIQDFDKIDPNKLRDRLIELSMQGTNYIVFYVNEDKAKSILAYLSQFRDKISPAKVVLISPRHLEDKQKEEIARAAWGFIDAEPGLHPITLDQHFKLREEKFNDLLEKLTSNRKLVKIVKESVEDEEGLEGFESPLHYQLKVFTVYYFAKKRNIPIEDIKTETKLDHYDIVPDVYIESKRIAVEIETFYGTGLTPWRKLWRTLEKYLGTKVANEVWVIIPPLQAMLYLKDLMSEIKELKKKRCTFIKFYTIDLSRKDLVPVEELSKKFMKIFSKTAK